MITYLDIPVLLFSQFLIMSVTMTEYLGCKGSTTSFLAAARAFTGAFLVVLVVVSVPLDILDRGVVCKITQVSDNFDRRSIKRREMLLKV